MKDRREVGWSGMKTDMPKDEKLSQSNEASSLNLVRQSSQSINMRWKQGKMKEGMKDKRQEGSEGEATTTESREWVKQTRRKQTKNLVYQTISKQLESSLAGASTLPPQRHLSLYKKGWHSKTQIHLVKMLNTQVFIKAWGKYTYFKKQTYSNI